MPTINGLTPTGCAQLMESLAAVEGAKHPAFADVKPETVELASKALARLAKEMAALRREPGGGSPTGPVTEIRSSAELEAALSKAREAGLAVVLDFFAPWCKPCVKAMPRYIDLASKHSDKAAWLKLNIDVVGDKVKDDWHVKKIPKFMVWRDGARVGACGTGYDEYFNSSLKLEEFVDHVLLGGPKPVVEASTSPHVTMIRSADGLKKALAEAESKQSLAMLAFCHGPVTPERFAANADKKKSKAQWIQVDVGAVGLAVATEWGAPVKPGAAKFVAWQGGDRIGECGKDCKEPFTSEKTFDAFVTYAVDRSAALAPPTEDAFDCFDADF